MILPETHDLILKLDHSVLQITLNRPQSRNALTQGMVSELNSVFDAVVAANDIRIVILRGAEGNFCAGADLKEVMGNMRPPQPGAADPVAVFSRGFGTFLRKVTALPLVVITICEGSVLGGGFGLACISDIGFAHVDAKFGLPETTRGLPPAQIAPFVVERIGLTQARKLCLTGAQFRGAEALRLGLVHESFSSEDELQSKLAETIKQVLNCAPQANAVTKQIILNVGHQDMDSVLDDAAQKFAACVRGPEAPEGISAFIQKRKPKWASQD